MTAPLRVELLPVESTVTQSKREAFVIGNEKIMQN